MAIGFLSDGTAALKLFLLLVLFGPLLIMEAIRVLFRG